MKILITGIAGFVGSHLAEFIFNNYPDYEVHGIVRPRTDLSNLEFIHKDIKLRYVDLTDSHAVKQGIFEINPDYVFHLAAQSDVKFSFNNPEQTLKDNVIGQLNLLQALIDTKVKGILIAGSSEEYGAVRPEEFPIKETQPLRPLSPYAVSKVTQEMLALQYYRSYNLPVVITRAFNHTGPRRGSNFAESSWAKQIAYGKTVTHGNLESYRDYTDVRDMVRAYWLALERGDRGEVYNICSGKTISMQSVLDILIHISGKKITTEIDKRLFRPSDVIYLLGDSTKFKVKTGWKPEYNLQKTLSDLYYYWNKIKKN